MGEEGERGEEGEGEEEGDGETMNVCMFIWLTFLVTVPPAGKAKAGELEATGPIRVWRRQ